MTNEKNDFISSEKNTNNFINLAIDKFKKSSNVAQDSKISIIDKIEQSDDTLKIVISYSGEYPIKTKTDIIMVPTPLIAELILDKKGELLNHQIRDPGTDMIQTLEEELNHLLKEDQVQFKNKDDDSSKSISKEFYIEEDNVGKKHLKRSRFY